MQNMSGGDELRGVALFVRDVWRHLHLRDRRRPPADEVVIVAYATAMALVNAEVGNVFRYLGAPGSVRSALQLVSAGAAGFSATLSDTAANVIEYLDGAGDLPTAKSAESVKIDRRIITLAARDYLRPCGGIENDTAIGGVINDSAIGRDIGLSHTSVRDRRLSRCFRIMQRLHVDAPTIWNVKGRPTSEPENGRGKIWKSADCSSGLAHAA